MLVLTIGACVAAFLLAVALSGQRGTFAEEYARRTGGRSLDLDMRERDE
jgi:hypothetical protein